MSRTRSWRQWAALLAILLIIAVVPSAGRWLLGTVGPGDDDAQPSYLPALEARRARSPFDPIPREDLRKDQPRVVIIGDSMSGRIDEVRLGELTGRYVAPLRMNATGPAYWYLMLKNYVAASGAKPEWVVVFFRDTNLTDVLFRLDGPYRSGLDVVAAEAEPALDRVIARRTGGLWSPLYRALESVYHVKAVRGWIEPALNEWPARLVAAPGRHPALIERVNSAFTLDKLRSIAQADLAAADDRDADFARFVDASVLPLMIAVAKDANLRLCFVRVMRRPTDGQPPPVSPALTRYVQELRTYVQANGAYVIDDHDDPWLATLPYGDGDHISRDARVPYTDRFWPKLQALAR